MRRFVLKLFVLLFAGAIINVAVAWGIAAWGASPLQSSNRVEYQPTAWPRRVPEQANEPTTSTRLVCTGSDVLNVLEKTDVREGKEPLELLMYRSGWPTRSLAWHAWPHVVRNKRGFAFFETGSLWADGIDLQALGDDHHYRNWRRLPIEPVWPGFAINAIFYAAMIGGVWLLFAAPGAIRKRVRRKRGQCAACGYSMHGTPDIEKCPECGESLPSAKRNGLA